MSDRPVDQPGEENAVSSISDPLQPKLPDDGTAASASLYEPQIPASPADTPPPGDISSETNSPPAYPDYGSTLNEFATAPSVSAPAAPIPPVTSPAAPITPSLSPVAAASPVPPANPAPPVLPSMAIPTVPAMAIPTPVSGVKELAGRIRQEMHKAIVGQEDLIEMLLVAVLAGGHVLLEGVPGTAKTLSIRALARIFDVTFSRIQFTPDLMPSDILGTRVFDPQKQEFELKAGPVFAGLVLADEVNRTPPKTQSALLEAMEERRVTIDGIPYKLPDPFLVCATQNPIEYEGTYPLPEAQLDRFMLKVLVPYPSAEDELNLLGRVQSGFRAQNLDTANLSSVLENSSLQIYREEIERVRIDPAVQNYIVQIIRASRDNRHLTLGASPRAAITLMLASKALAAIRGRSFVTPDDIKEMALPVLRHRLVVKPESEVEGFTGDRIVQSVLQSVEVPR